jgi:glucose-1-phosphatase
MNMKETEAIIFDLGGVILNIDFSMTQKALERLGLKDAGKHFGKYTQEGFFDQLDRGEITENTLFDEIRKLLPEPAPDYLLRDAWNAMILDFPSQRILLLEKVKARYRTFLLSNTNAVHFPFYNRLIQDMGVDSLESLFHHTYLSFREGMRKPEPEFFLKLLKEQGLQPETTVFIDDTEMHVEAAVSLGIKTIHLKEGMDVCDLFDDAGLKGEQDKSTEYLMSNA